MDADAVVLVREEMVPLDSVRREIVAAASFEVFHVTLEVDEPAGQAVNLIVLNRGPPVWRLMSRFAGLP